MTSHCHNAPVFRDVHKNPLSTNYYICTECKEGCEIK